MKTTKKFKWKSWYWIVVIILVALISGGGGGLGVQRYFNNEITKKDSIINASKERTDSLYQTLRTTEETIKQRDSRILLLESLNRQTDVQIKWKERIIYRDRDTSFITNAKRIADSSDRFYKRGNDLR